jgi:2-keto-4-pentenoate hydratase/2-oxohepta-3-ene-1,7-dioic acid hydratase in catechol pathway
LQTINFDNYKGSVNSTLNSIISKNASQDQHITNITTVLPLLLSIDSFNLHIENNNATFGTVFNKNNTQDTEITNIKNTLPSYLQSATAASTYQPIGDYVLNNTLNNYTSNVSLTLNSIINKNNTQDTSINNILITLPSYLQSATAASTYQPIGDYVVNNTLNNYTSNVSLTLNSIINKNNTQDTSINNILITITKLFTISYSSINVST